MRILYYSPHPNLNLNDPAGYGTHMREMIAAFRALGHQVQPVIMGGVEPRSSDGPSKPSLLKRIAKQVIPPKRWETLKDKRLIAFDQRAKLQLDTAIALFKPDLIYERANYMQVSGVRAAKDAGIAHILEVNSPYTEEKKELEGDSHLLHIADDREAEQLRTSSHVVVVSSSLRDYFVKKHRLASNRFTIVPNAIDPAKVVVQADALAEKRRDLGLDGKVVVGWVGSIQPWHGIQKMIEGFSGLPDDLRSDARLLIVGGGESLPEMRTLAATSKGSNQIIFTDAVPHAEVFQYLAAMDICLLPNTKWYCSPIKIFEYGAMGKSIIASNHAAVLDVMEPDLDGLIIEPTSEALTNALTKVLPKPDLRARYAVQFKEKVFAEHTWEANANRVLHLAENLISQAAQ